MHGKHPRSTISQRFVKHAAIPIGSEVMAHAPPVQHFIKAQFPLDDLHGIGSA
jgi:hypothetical protein